MEQPIGIQVGSTPESIQERLKAIMVIVQCETEGMVKVEALRALTKLCRVKHVTVSGCHVVTNVPTRASSPPVVKKRGRPRKVKR